MPRNRKRNNEFDEFEDLYDAEYDDEYKPTSQNRRRKRYEEVDDDDFVYDLPYIPRSTRTRKRKEESLGGSEDPLAPSSKIFTSVADAVEKEIPKENNEYEVEDILDFEVDKNGVNSYLIKWKYYPKEESTWEPVHCMDGCPKILAKFEKEYKKHQQLIRDLFGDELLHTERELDNKLANDSIKNLVGGVNVAGKPYAIVEWRNADEYSLVRFELINAKMPELSLRKRTFKYFNAFK